MSDSYFTSIRLGKLHLNKTIDLEDSSANYKNAGYRMDKAISNDTTYSSGTAVAKITKAISTNNGIPANISSNIVPHVINKVSIQDASVWDPGIEVIKRWTDNAVDISSNQAQFKIWNLALQSSSSKPVYTIGNHTDFSRETGETNLFDISRNNRRDAYSRDGYDKANLGFWYSEDIQYKINFSTISISGENLYNPLRYELRSYYNETGRGDVSSNHTGSTIILQNTANANRYIYFDDLSGVPSIVKNGANMIQYTTNNKINGIPNLHLFSDKTFSIRLRYLVNNYSTRFLLDESKSVLQHYFSYNDTQSLKDVTWSSHTSTPPSFANHDYERNVDKWDISGIEINTAANLHAATSGITLKIDATNTLDSSGITINNTHSDVYKFIYDKPTITEFNDISNSLCEIPSGFDPTYVVSSSHVPPTPNVPGNYDASGAITNDLQMSMWNGYFYSNTGWKKITGISSNTDISAHQISDIPVFKGEYDEYKWTTFKYTCNRSYTKAYILALGFSENSTNITLNSIETENVKIFAYFNRKDTYGTGKYYWLNVGKKGGIDPEKASNKTYNYEGGLRFTPKYNESESIFINGNSVKSDFLPDVSNPILNGYNRLIGAYFNGINTNSNKTIFVAIGIINSVDFHIKKPHVWLADGSTNLAFEKLI